MPAAGTGSADPARALLFRVRLLLGLCLLMLVVMALLPRIAQDPAYHAFADGRPFLGVPNFLNVASNFPFLVVGALGLGFLARDRRSGGSRAFATPDDRRPYWPFFVGIGLTAFGSAYYHWRPSNATLFWDRLPMTIGFMALLASVIGERISRRAGARLLWPLIVAGAASALYWHVTEQQGAGDLRPYGLVQFGSLVLVPLILALFPARYTRDRPPRDGDRLVRPREGVRVLRSRLPQARRGERPHVEAPRVGGGGLLDPPDARAAAAARAAGTRRGRLGSRAQRRGAGGSTRADALTPAARAGPPSGSGSAARRRPPARGG